MQSNTIPGFKYTTFNLCRIIFSICILADVGWYVTSYETRSAYLRVLGLPAALLPIIIIAYSFLGLCLLFNFYLEKSCFCMIITYALVGFLVHHPVGRGGIGEYPTHIHGEINFLQVLTYAGLIGGVLVIFGSVDLLKRGKLMQGSTSYAIVLGRAFACLHFIVGTIYFKFYQYSLRKTQISMMGGSPVFHIFCIGTIHLFASYSAWLGDGNKTRKIGSLTLAIVTVVMAVVENAAMATSVGVYHMKPEAQYHQFIMQMQIAATCMLLYSTSELEVKPYKDAQE